MIDEACRCTGCGFYPASCVCAPILAWTREPPTKPGWYWSRRGEVTAIVNLQPEWRGSARMLVQEFCTDEHDPMAYADGAEWRGVEWFRPARAAAVSNDGHLGL